MGTNGECFNPKGSPVWPSQPLPLLNRGITYPNLLQQKDDQYDRQVMLPPFSSLLDTNLPNVNWWKAEEFQIPMDNILDYRNRLCEIPTVATPVTKLQQIYNNSNNLPCPNIYTGVIRNSRFDFVNEEPHKKRLKKMNEHGSSDDVDQDQVLDVVNEGVTSSQPDQAVITRSSRPQEEPISLNQARDQHALTGHSSLSTTQFSTTASSSVYSTSDYTKMQYSNGIMVVNTTADTSTTENTKLQYSLAGQSQLHDRPCFQSLSSLETYVIERPGAENSSNNYVIPNVSTSTSPFDHHGYHGMTCFPSTYPAPLPPYLQYFPLFPGTDPYCLLRKRYKDVAPYVFPTFIQPKPFTSAFPYRTIPETPLPSKISYPNPADMFRSANLIPPRMSTTTRPSTSTITSVSKTDSSTKAQSNSKPQPTWLKTDDSYSYTVATAPSEVMSYLPNTVNQINNGHLSSDSSNYDEYDSDDYDSDDETTTNKKKPLISITSLIPKEKSPPSYKAHVCSICGKMFARAFTLKTHQRVHSGERPYSCKICFKTFAQGGGLDSHMRIHTGEKPYECPVCGRSFSHSSAVKSHHRRHTGEKPYRCKVCPKRFADQSTLTKHNRTHSGVRPYKCQICHMAFTQLGNMNKHMKNIHTK